MKAMLAGALALVSLALVLGVNSAGEKGGKAKFTNKEVMEKAHEDEGLLEKILEGKGSAKEKKELVELYTSLAANTPPMGDKAKWAKVTKTLVEAAKAVEASKDDKAVKALLKVTNCKSCHEEFRPMKKK